MVQASLQVHHYSYKMLLSSVLKIQFSSENLECLILVLTSYTTAVIVLLPAYSTFMIKDKCITLMPLTLALVNFKHKQKYVLVNCRNMTVSLVSQVLSAISSHDVCAPEVYESSVVQRGTKSN